MDNGTINIFSSAQETLHKTDDILGHGTNLTEFLLTEILQSVFSGPQWN